MSTDTDTITASRSYVLGKGTSALRQIGELCEALRRTDLSDRQLRDEVQSHLSYALYDFTKVLSTIVGVEWNTEDRDKVAQGIDGVEELLVRYGSMRLEATRAYRVRTAGERIYELARQPKAEARTLMHEQLRLIPAGTRPFHTLADLLEQVTMGERPWSDLQQWCAEHLVAYAPKPVGDTTSEEGAATKSR